MSLSNYKNKNPAGGLRIGDTYPAFNEGENRGWVNITFVDIPKLDSGESKVYEVDFWIPHTFGNPYLWTDTLEVNVIQLSEVYIDTNLENNVDNETVEVLPSGDATISCIIYFSLPFMFKCYGAQGIAMNSDIRSALNTFYFVKYASEGDLSASGEKVVSVVLALENVLKIDPTTSLISFVSGIFEGARDCGNLFTLGVQVIGAAILNGFDILLAVVSSPADILIIDEHGRCVGYMNGTIYEVIVGSEVTTINDKKIILISWSSNYTTKLRGTGTGTMDVQMILPAGNKAAKIVEYKNISVSQTMEATIDVSPANPEYSMNIDYDGDGVTDEEKSPDVNETLLPEENIFDSRASENPYPSISGTHTGSITPD